LTPGVLIRSPRLPFSMLHFSCALGCPLGRGWNCLSPPACLAIPPRGHLHCAALPTGSSALCRFCCNAWPRVRPLQRCPRCPGWCCGSNFSISATMPGAISFAGPAAFHDVISAGAMLCFILSVGFVSILRTDLAIWLHGHPSGGLAFILQRIRAAI